MAGIYDDQGFPDARAGLQALHAQQVNFTAAVESGQARMVPEAARAAAQACRDHIRRLDQRILDARLLARQLSFGDFLVGQQLEHKFQQKATGIPTSMAELLAQGQQIFENMARTYDRAAELYDHTERANTAAFYGFHQ